MIDPHSRLWYGEEAKVLAAGEPRGKRVQIPHGPATVSSERPAE